MKPEKLSLLHRCHKNAKLDQIFVNILVLFTRSAYRLCKEHRRQPCWISRVVRFSVRHRETIVAKLVLILAQLSFPLVRGFCKKSVGNSPYGFPSPPTSVKQVQKNRFLLGKRVFTEHWKVANSSIGLVKLSHFRLKF